MLKSPVLAALAAAAVIACQPTTSNTNPPPGGEAPPPGGTVGAPPADGSAAPTPTEPVGVSSTGTEPGPGPGVVAGGPNDSRFLAPEISHSKGQAGGIVVLFPRIIPGTIADANAALAAQVQQKVKAVAEKALPGKPIDVRPRPERVCPKTGCDAMSINVLFSRNGDTNACVAVAMINAPGTSPTKLIPWGGLVNLKSDTIQFRDMPESFVQIKDYVPCDQLITQMAAQDSFIEAAIRAAAGGAAPSTTPAPAGPSGPANVSAKPAK